MKLDRFNLLIYGANIVFLVFAVVVLLWLKGRFEDDLRDTIEKTQGLFTRAVIGDPDNRRVQFSQWEERAALASESQFIARLVVSKIVAVETGDREVIVRPFWLGALLDGDSPREHLTREGMRREALRDAEGVYGAVYYDLDMSTLDTVRIAIWTLAALLVLGLVVLTTRLYSQERALSKTTVELEEKRRQLIRIERLALVGQLTANIFHDIRKPVLNIRHELEDLRESLGNFAGAAKGLKRIREHTDLFIDILRDLNVERMVSARDGEPEFVELKRVVEQAASLVQYERKAVSLRIEAEPNMPLVLAQPYRLIQVFSNLVLNAYQAMEGKGEMRIQMRRVEGGEYGMAEIEFTDTGPGIPPAELPRIFAPFFTTKTDHDGAGLGLYISRGILHDLDGDLLVNSREGVGAAFIVRLPAAAPK